MQISEKHYPNIYFEYNLHNAVPHTNTIMKT